MKHLRIIQNENENDKLYYIQYKGWFGIWRFLEYSGIDDDDDDGFYPVKFNCLDRAEEYIDKNLRPVVPDTFKIIKQITL